MTELLPENQAFTPKRMRIHPSSICRTSICTIKPSSDITRRLFIRLNVSSSKIKSRHTKSRREAIKPPCGSDSIDWMPTILTDAARPLKLRNPHQRRNHRKTNLIRLRLQCQLQSQRARGEFCHYLTKDYLLQQTHYKVNSDKRAKLIPVN
jgi:hypothetical protein